MRRLAGESATLPPVLALLRMPLSTFAPAPQLPPWGALAQVLVAFALLEAAMGWRRTLAVALGATADQALPAGQRPDGRSAGSAPRDAACRAARRPRHDASVRVSSCAVVPVTCRSIKVAMSGRESRRRRLHGRGRHPPGWSLPTGQAVERLS
jgi:hypothetical protein